ncbi:MAG: M48 family metalloprotease [Caldivirga sp.]
MRAYSRLLESLVRLGSIDMHDVLNSINLVISEFRREFLYAIYTWNAETNVEVYFRRFSIQVLDSSLKIQGDGRGVDEVSRFILRNTLIGDGKRVVMLFRDEGDEYVKVPTKPEFAITVNPAVSFIISSILTLVIFLLLTKYGIAPTIISVIAQVMAVNLLYTYLSFMRMVKVRVDGSRIIRVTVTLPTNTPEDTLFRLISYASSLRRIRREELTQVTAILRAIGGSTQVNVKVDYITIPSISGVKIYLVPSPDCNAVSMNLLDKFIVMGTKLVACLNQGELEAVINHELGHIVHLDTYKSLIASIIYSLASAIMLFYVIPVIGLTPLSVVIYVSVVLAAIVISLALSRLNEVKADLYALSKGYRAPLATALVKVTYPSIYSTPIKAVFLSHPSTLSRVNKLLKATGKTHGRQL